MTDEAEWARAVDGAERHFSPLSLRPGDASVSDHLTPEPYAIKHLAVVCCSAGARQLRSATTEHPDSGPGRVTHVLLDG